MGQKKSQKGYAATKVKSAALRCSINWAQNLAKTQGKKCFVPAEKQPVKKTKPLILPCNYLDSFSVSPPAKQGTHWHSHYS